MKSLVSISASILFLGASLFGQIGDDLNEGLGISGGGAGLPGTLTWNGLENRIYFIQTSENLIDWTYAPLIEPGQGLPKSWFFHHSEEKFFLRLIHTDRLTVDPESEDFDQDKVKNIDELFSTATGFNSTNPFSAADTNANGVPDDWEAYWFKSLSTVTETSSFADGDAFTDAQEFAMGTDPTALTVLSVTYLSGDSQIVTAGEIAPEPLLVSVEDTAGKRVGNAPVTFTISGGASRLARAITGSLPLHVAPISDTINYTDSLTVLTDRNGIAQLEHQVHAMAPVVAGQSMVIRAFVTESVNYYDFSVYANRHPSDILFTEPGTSIELPSISLPDTIDGSIAIADLDFLDADSTAHGSFENGTYTNLFSIVRAGATWQLATAAGADFYEQEGIQYDVNIVVSDGHGGFYSETIQVSVVDADLGDSPILAAPTISQPGGQFQTELSLMLSNSNERGLIFYTLDGSDPKIQGQLYTSGTTIDLAAGFQADAYESIELRAVVRDNGIADSAELSETYIFKPAGNSAVIYTYAFDSSGTSFVLTTLTNSTVQPKVRLGWGWNVNGTFVADLSVAAEEIYVIYYDPNGYQGVDRQKGNERYMVVGLTGFESFWPSQRKIKIGKGWIGRPGGVNSIPSGSGIFENFTGRFIPDASQPETIYAGFKDFSRGDSLRRTQAVLTTDVESLDYNHITLGAGKIDNPIGNFAQLNFTPDPALASQPVYFGFNLFENDNASIITKFGRWVYAYNPSEISDSNGGNLAMWNESFGEIWLSDGWITGVGGTTTSSNAYEPDFNKTPVALYGGLKWVRPASGLYNFDVDANVAGINQITALRGADWVACSVNAFTPTYRGHDLGLGWTTGPFSFQPYIDPLGFAGNLPNTDVRYRRLSWEDADAESSSLDRMDYLIINAGSAASDFYAPSASGWAYREKNRDVDMELVSDLDDFIAQRYHNAFFLSSLDPIFSQDSDRDGLSDGLEIFAYRTDPYLADTDGDLIPDGIEVAQASTGLDPNTKNDALAAGYIQDVALLGQGLVIPLQAEPVAQESFQANSGHPYSVEALQPPQILTGSRYRKIGLNGFPLSDEPPQAEEEDDQEKEETYIDAFDLALSHSVTDAYIALPGSSDLALQVRRNFSGSVWDSNSGWRPGERLDRPFGAGWSSNLTPFVNRVVVYNNNDSYEEIYVQDESGVTHRFLKYTYQSITHYLAIPNSRSQQDALLHTLSYDGTQFTFTKKHGTTITFEAQELDQGWSTTDRAGDNNLSRRNYFSRAADITDRHGNTLSYSYEHSASNVSASLIPESITFSGRNGAEQTISIDAGRYRVNSITDPRGHTVYYNYENLSGGVVDAYIVSYSIPVLRSVEFALSAAAKLDPAYDAAISTYTYELAGEADYSFYSAGSRMSHLNLKTISDGNQNTYRFTYDFNRTNRVSGGTGSDGRTMWYVQNGSPRQVVRVDLPGSGTSARFKHYGLSQYVNDTTISQVTTNWDEYLAGYRATVAYDTENNAHVYRFNNPRIEALDDPFQQPLNDPRLMYFLEMEISHYEGSNLTLTVPTLTEGTAGDPASFASGVVNVTTTGNTTWLGSETFTFDLASGLQLSSVTDFSGNITDYFYETNFPQNSNFFIYNTALGLNLNPYFNSTSGFGSKLPEPTRKIARNARWTGTAWEDVTEHYTYGEDVDNVWFLMDSITDGRGTKTIFDIDTYGNRTSETIYAAVDLVTPVQQTTFGFDDIDFPSVATRRTVKGLTPSEDLTTYFLLDDLGRTQTKAVDVFRQGAASHPNALITATAFDANSNRTHLIDPNTAKTVSGDLTDPAIITTNATYTWTYDTRNRRTAQTHPETRHPVSGAVINPAATEYTVRDKRGNHVGQIDLNRAITVNQYDGLNRKVRSIRVMDASTLTASDSEAFRTYAPAAGDLVTTFGYNRLNSVVTQKDPEGNRTFLLYDGLQRLRKTIDADSNETTYEYDTAANTGSGAFDRDSFKPIRTVDARGYATVTEFDPRGNPIIQFAQYAIGSPNRYRVTANQFDPSGNATHEAVYADYIGQPDSTSFAANTPADLQLTQTKFDALNRPTVLTRADGSTERSIYTQSGLLKQAQLFHPGDDPATAAPFRVQTHFHDGAGRMLASRSLPIAPEVEGEITWIVQGQRYDANSNIVEIIDPRNVQYGDIGTYTIASPPVPDHSSDLNFETRYNSRNRPVMQIEPRSEDLSRTLTALDGSQSTQTLSAIRPYSLIEYDQAGNATVQTDAFGHETISLYDRANRPTHEFTAPVPTLNPFDLTHSTVSLAHRVKQHVLDRNGNILQTRSGLANPAGVTGPSLYLTPLDAVDTDGIILWPETNVPARPTAQTSVTWLRTDVTNTYDTLNRLVTTTDGAGITVANEYDSASNRTAMTDGEQQRTEFEYDGFNRNTVMRHPDSSEKTFSFNALVQTSRSDEESQTTAYSYDFLNRLKTVDYASDAIIDREYFYDPEGNILAVTEVSSDATRQTNVAYAYDAAGRLSKETLGATHQSVISSQGVTPGQLPAGVGSDGVTHDYTYDLAGNLTQVRYGASSRVLHTSYDLLNRAQTIDEDVNDDGTYNSADGDRRTRYVYDLRGSIVRKDTADGLSIRKIYDALQRPQQITGPLDDYGITRYQYQQFYDFAGNVARINESYPSFLSKLDDRTIRNQYDLVDRLTVEQITTNSEVVETTYGYDDAHNRVSKILTKDDRISPIETLENITYTLNNDLNQVDSYTNSVTSETVSFTYDLNGARVTKTEASQTTTYGYDFENRLISLTDPDGTYAYGYDYRTRRTIRDESLAGGDKTFVIYSGGLSIQEWKTFTISDHNLEPSSTDDTLQVEYVRGSGLGGGIAGLLYTIRDLDEDGQVNDIRLNHYNARGDLVAQTDHRGEVMYQAAYEAFGESGDTDLGGDPADPRTQTEGETADRQRSNTKDRDPTGLINEAMRYRSDHLYLTRDPLMFVDGPNMYAQVMQNPWTKFDPLGLYYDEAQFDSNGYMRNLEDSDGNREYNDRVGQFNQEWEKARETPTGSAMHDYIQSHENWKFSVELFADTLIPGEPDTPYATDDGRSKSTVNFPSKLYDYGSVVHEFFHSIQAAELVEYSSSNSLTFDGNGDPSAQLKSYMERGFQQSGNALKSRAGLSVFDSSDYSSGEKYKNRNPNTIWVPSKEAQSTRIENNVRLEYLRKSNPRAAAQFEQFGWAEVEYRGWRFQSKMGTRE
jgi:YD repeat-containing protein